MITLREAFLRKAAFLIKPKRPPSHPLSYLYDASQIKAGQAEAARLLSITDPVQLSFSFSLDETHLEAQRLALMGIVTRKSFESVGQGDRQAARDLSRQAAKLLAGYPPPRAFEGFEIKSKYPLIIQDKQRASSIYAFMDEPDYISIDYREKVIKVKQAALIEAIFYLTMREAVTWGKVRSTDEIYRSLSPYLNRLNSLINFAPPLNYSLIDRSMINNDTVLPFNIKLPF